MTSLTDMYAALVDGCGENAPAMTADDVRSLYQSWTPNSRYEETGAAFIAALFEAGAAWSTLDEARDLLTSPVAR